MPIYEYQCQACQHQLEALRKISDEPLRICPACNEPALKKKVSAVAFRLKGSGWYETDFKTGDKRNLSSDSNSDGGGKSEGKSEGKGGDKKTSGSDNRSSNGSKPAPAASAGKGK